MSYEQSRKDIQGFFADNFEDLDADRIAWDNVKFDIPTDDEPWLRFSVQHTNSNYVSLGPNRRTRREGIIFIQVFVPKDTETLEANELTDGVVSIFETKSLSGTVFKSPIVREVGIDKAWFQVNISVQFYYDDITILS